YAAPTVSTATDGDSSSSQRHNVHDAVMLVLVGAEAGGPVRRATSRRRERCALHCAAARSDERSIACASSIRTSTGASSAAAASRLRTPGQTVKRSPAAGGPRATEHWPKASVQERERGSIGHGFVVSTGSSARNAPMRLASRSRAARAVVPRRLVI